MKARRMLVGLAAGALMIGTVLAAAAPASAATHVVNDQASCESLDGLWFDFGGSTPTCNLNSLTVDSGDTVEFGSSVDISIGSLTNNGTIQAPWGFSVSGGTNNGTIYAGYNIYVWVLGTLQNNGTIYLCNGAGIINGAVTGTAPLNQCGPVTDSDSDGVPDAADVCAGTALPDTTSAQQKKNRYIANADGAFVGGAGNSSGYSVEDTGGCSARQIITAMNLGSGHSKHGLSMEALQAWIATLPA